MSDPAPTSDEVAAANILVIDDEEIIHSSLRKILTRYSHEVTTTFAASEGLELIAANSYDLVITDLMMPKMNGIELLEELRQRSIEVPVLMLTGYPTIRTAIQALRLGAVDYLAKPFTRHELLAPINRVLRRPGLDESVTPLPRADPAPPTSEGLEAPDLDLSPGDRYCLREHAWAIYRQDGAMDVGIEANFLASMPSIVEIEAPHEGDLIEQGYVSLRLTTRSGELHGVFTPLSGQVLDVNTRAVANPGNIDANSWIVRILPTNLEAELPLLRRCG